MNLKRMAGIGGLIFVVAVVIINLMQGAAGRPFGDPNEVGYLDDYLAYYLDADAVVTVTGLAVPFIWVGLAVFAAGLAFTLLRIEWPKSGEAWAIVGLIGITMQNAIFPGVIAVDTAQFRIVSDTGAMDAGLHQAHDVLFGLNSISLAIALLGFSTAMLRSGATRRWLPVVGFVSALLLAFSTTNLGFSTATELYGGLGLIGFILWLVFIAASSIWLLRQRDAVSETTAQGKPSEPPLPAGANV